MELTSHLKHALTQAVEDSLRELVRQSEAKGTSKNALSQASTLISGIVQDTLSRYSRLQNDRAAVNTLPAEIFLNIVSQTSILDIIAASHVCQSWRDTMLCDAHLWTEILGSYDRVYSRSDAFVREILVRTRDAPVKLAFDIHTRDSVALIEQHLHHFAQLGVSIVPGIDDSDTTGRSYPTLVSALMYALRNPAPLLEYIQISCRGAVVVGDIGEVPADVFAGSAPRLHTAILHDVRLPFHPYTAFERVSAFSFSAYDPIGFGDMTSNIGLYDELRHLVLLGPSSATTAMSQYCGQLSAARLETLEVVGASDERDIVLALGDACPKTICLHFADADDVLALLQTMHLVTEVRFASRGTLLVGIEVSYDSGRTMRATYNLAWGTNPLPVPISVFQSVVFFSLHEHMWPDHGFPPAPQLQHLRIFIGVHYGSTDSDHCSIFQLSLDAVAWQVPNLEYLSLSSLIWTSGHDPGILTPELEISAADLAFFVRHHLQFTAERLPNLTLNLLPLYERMECEEMRDLLDLVDSLSITAVVEPVRIHAVHAGATDAVSSWMSIGFN